MQKSGATDDPPVGVAGVFRALSNPTRLEILGLIGAEDEALGVRDIVARFDLHQPTISHHLRSGRDTIDRIDLFTASANPRPDRAPAVR